jgi:WXXGXW repeat (2 copies)
MTDRPVSPLVIALVAFASPWVAPLPAQDFPPAPPLPVRFAQVEAPEPTLIGPALPGFQAPHPDDLLPADPSMAVPDADIEAFARGPVHQAFADVYELDPAPNVIVTVAPPAAVDELPPDQVPTGDNVQWIAGYWSWDEESKDYLWVSGVWRDVPPGRRWVPGYWAEVEGGFQFVSGFWTNVESQELAYLPQPPASLEVGPNVPPPSDDQVWVPGNWSYVSNNYQWSPGYYTPCQQDYMWIPNQYYWTPRGCVFVRGYWDYRFARRGMLFSPVRFRRSLVGYGYGRPACYQPRYSVNMTGFLIHLFVRPRCRSFYYGDYYGNQYASIGFSPWYRRTTINRHCHDPAYSFYRLDSRRQGINFDLSINTWHQRFESNRDIRPPRLMQDQDQFLARHRGDQSAQLAVMSNRFEDVVKQDNTGHAFHKIEKKDIDLLRENSQVNRTLETARRQVERDVRLVKSGDLKPDQSVDLPLKDASSRTEREGRRGPEGDATVATPNKLVLGSLPETLKEKSKVSAATAERIRQQSARSNQGKPSTDSPLNVMREKTAEQPKVRTQLGEQADVTRDREKSDRSGKTQLVVPPTIDGGPQPLVHDGVLGRPDRTESKGATADPGNGAAHLEEMRQKNEAQRIAREAEKNEKKMKGTDVPQIVTPASRNPRILDGGPLVNPKADPKVDRQPERVIENSSGKPNLDEMKQRSQEQRVTRDAENQAKRSAPTPQMIENLPLSVIEKAPKVDAGAVREQNVRERNIPQRNDNPAPVFRQQQPVERAPKMEKAPVQQAPRQVERPAPVERASKVERPAPVQRAPKAERSSGGSQQPSRKKGKD